MSSFFNLEARGINFYRQVRSNYADLVTQPGQNAPVIAWLSYTGSNSVIRNEQGVMLDGTVYEFIHSPRRLRSSEDSGARIVNSTAIATAPAFLRSKHNNTVVYFAESEFASLTDAQVAVKKVLRGVDIVIDETFRIQDDQDKV